MSKGKLLSDVVSDLRRLADGIEALAESVNVASPQNAESPFETAKPQPSITLEQVRALLADKSRSGKTAGVRDLLKSFGADKLSEIDPASYAEMMKAAEEL